MTQQKLCGVCGKNEASHSCDICGIPLCDMCSKDVAIDEINPGTQVKGMSLSPMRASRATKKVCPKCMEEADFL